MRHASQRIGVRQWRHRRPQAAGSGEGHKHQNCLMLGADNRQSQRRRERRDDDGVAQRLPPFGQTGHEGEHRKAGDGGNRRDDPDPGRLDPDRLQPDREERQIGTEQSEYGAVKQRQPRRESPGRRLRCDGDL